MGADSKTQELNDKNASEQGKIISYYPSILQNEECFSKYSDPADMKTTKGTEIASQQLENQDRTPLQSSTSLEPTSIALGQYQHPPNLKKTGSSYANSREVNRSHMRFKRSKDEAYREKERLLNRERMRRLRSDPNYRSREKQIRKFVGSDGVMVVQAIAIPIEPDALAKDPSIVEVVADMKLQANIDPSL